jgi:hypothetical protein
MNNCGTAHEAAVLKIATSGRSWRHSALLAVTTLVGASVGFVGAASASQLPKVSTPQVRVNTGVHVNTVNVHSAVSTNSSALKVGTANQFAKNNGGKGKGATPRDAQLLLKLDGIKGESQDDGHKNEIEIQSFR